MNVFKEIFNNPAYDQTNNMVRWNGLSRVKDETVGHHTHIVTFFSRVIFEEIFNSSKVTMEDKSLYISEMLTYSMLHDFDESFTGDILHTFKHNPLNGKGIKDNIEEYLDHVRIQNFNLQTPLHNMLAKYAFQKDVEPFLKDIVKLADWLSMLFYIKKEQMLGNRNLEVQFSHCVESTKMQACVLWDSLENKFPNSQIFTSILQDINKTNFYE